MISDDDVWRFFQSLTIKPVFGGFGTLQIYRGKSPPLWEGAHPGGCERHHVVFNKFKAIPEECFDCYKVLITPRTVIELFKVLLMSEKLALPNNNVRKCMAEGRKNCSGAYKCFVYCKGVDEGKEVRDIVRKVVSEEISADVPVTLKRGCSEFAQAYPNYSPTKPGVAYMKYDEAWRVHEDFVDKNFTFSPAPPSDPRERDTPYTAAEVFAMHYWLHYAATIGDNSYLKVAGRTLAPVAGLKRPAFVIKA